MASFSVLVLCSLRFGRGSRLACNFCPSRVKIQPIYERLLKKIYHSSVKMLAAKKTIIAAGNHEDLIFSDHPLSLLNSRC